ncbi:probable ATP-dependent RNA helicase DHX35 isoform X2 [Leptidea sinapis]|uniref:probable ATP-dependent RNA helicase DHX35 isoform X2 n=1 Tax=Leptidea sinapis TaxID=189913 RepID=UPI0021C46B1F|nr:probable ATP-dependent RNA helicase DHX35 isoform X2 [Leptidea sinapis]
MFGRKPLFQKPGDDSLYPVKRKDGTIETLVNPNIDSALSIDNDSKTSVVYNRYHHLPLQTQRQKLPVFQYRNHILYLLENYQTLILIGETGCGKSTQVPQFMTEGVLLREMFASPLLMQYSCIIIDEVHERSQMTDVVMGLLKKIAKKRKNLKIIVSSATMNADFLKDFFNIKESGGKDTSVVLSMQGRTHPIDVFYVEEPVADYVKATVDTVIKIHENQPFGDILAFLTSSEEITSALETLRVYADENNERNAHRNTFPSGVASANMSVLPLYGSLPLYAQIKAFQTAERNVRKVILSTNIAETSVTIPGVVYVIDCGFHKLPYFSPELGVECLTVSPVSKHNAIQRAARAARTNRGYCYRLYTEAEYDKLPESVPPEMCRTDLTSVLLLLKALGIHNVLRFTFPSPPPAKSTLAALETLYALRAVDKEAGLTDDGHKMAELPLRPMLAKMVCNSGEYGCIDEMLSIVSMLQVDTVFNKQTTGKLNVAAKLSRRNNFEVSEGDIIMYLNILEAYIKLRGSQQSEQAARKASKAWCQKYYINYKVMEKACEIRRSLEKLVKEKFNMENAKFDAPEFGSVKCERIMRCVVSGLFPQAASLGIEGHYRGVRGAELHISPDSCLYHQQQPQWLVFGSVQSSGDKVYMRDIMRIDKQWLMQTAPHYYHET